MGNMLGILQGGLQDQYHSKPFFRAVFHYGAYLLDTEAAALLHDRSWAFGQLSTKQVVTLRSKPILQTKCLRSTAHKLQQILLLSCQDDAETGNRRTRPLGVAVYHDGIVYRLLTSP